MIHVLRVIAAIAAAITAAITAAIAALSATGAQPRAPLCSWRSGMGGWRTMES